MVTLGMCDPLGFPHQIRYDYQPIDPTYKEMNLE
jgi:hypothetical protein